MATKHRFALGTFLLIVTNGSGEESLEPVDRPARATTATTTTKARTSTSPAAAAAAAPTNRFVKVQPGDTPTSIADRSGISAERLLELNPSVDPSSLKPGQTLKLAR